MDEQAAQQQEGSPELFMFLASTVHDMKNSISVLSGTLENLLGAHQSSAAPEYGQMDVGKPGYPFDPAPRSVRELVELVAGQAHMLLQSRGIAFDVDYPQNAIWTLDEDLVIGVLVLLTIWWFTSAKTWFTGPVRTVDEPPAEAVSV